MSNGEYVFGSMFLCFQKPPDDAHVDHGPLRVVRKQVQIPFIILRSSSHIPEMDMKDAAFLNFFDSIHHLPPKAERTGLKGERPVQARSYLHGYGRFPALRAVKAGVWGMYMDRRFDEGRRGHHGPGSLRIVRVDLCVLDDVPHILLGTNLDADLSLPPGRNGRIEDGRRASSVRAYPFNSERFVSLIGDGESMVEEVPLLDFPKVDPGFFNHHPGPACG